MSIYHPLAAKESLTAEDLHGENFLLIRRGWNHYLDQMRDELWRDHPLLKTLPMDWSYTIPYSPLHAPDPSPTVRRLLDAVRRVMEL